MASKAGPGADDHEGNSVAAPGPSPLSLPTLEWPRGGPLLAFAAFAAISLFVYQGALRGVFVSDDFGYIVTNPYTTSLDVPNLIEMFDPAGQAREYTANYAPIHLVVTAIERQIFADEVLGYHLVNVALHALAALLLAALLGRSQVAAPLAIAGTLFFLVHPANVEAVAWISQLKTTGSLVLTLAAMLLHRRIPMWSGAVFAVALLTKASAYAALPMIAALTWARSGGPGGSRAHWQGVGVWLLVLFIYVVPELSSFGFGSAFEEPAYSDPWVHVRSIAAVGSRYLVMAVTSYGVAAFQEPAPVTSFANPWWLAALPLAALLVWRIVATLRARSEEAAWWLFAAASFGPVSQILPFVNPLADRYLYFILPGLIGGVLLAAARFPRQGGARARSIAWVLAFVVLCGFGARSAARASLWKSETKLLLDAARHYPEGGTASFLDARSAAQRGDVSAAIPLLRRAEENHAARFSILLTDPGLAPIRRDPAFQELVREMAGRWIEKARRRGVTTQPEYRIVGLAHQVRGEYALAAEAFERALAIGGFQDDLVREELVRMRERMPGSG